MISEGERSKFFVPVTKCWICSGSDFLPGPDLRFDFAIYAEQDPELAEYTGFKSKLSFCRSCRFMQPSEMPTLPNFFSRMYDTRWSEDWIHQEFNATYRDRIFDEALRTLRQRLASTRGKRFLDVGAHVGRLVHLAQKAGWTAEGIELNPTTASFAEKMTGCPIHQLPAEKLIDQSKPYDAITMLDVMEHIPEPIRLLKGLHGLLAPKGWIVIKVPCGIGQWRKELFRTWFQPSYRLNIAGNLVHVNHFSPQALQQALSNVGFDSIEIKIGAPEEPPLNGTTDFIGWLKRMFRRSVCSAGRVMPSGVYSPFSLNLMAIARKP